MSQENAGNICCCCGAQMNCSSTENYNHYCTSTKRPIHGFCLQDEGSGDGICKACFKSGDVENDHDDDEAEIFELDSQSAELFIVGLEKASSGAQILDLVSKIPKGNSSLG